MQHPDEKESVYRTFKIPAASLVERIHQFSAPHGTTTELLSYNKEWAETVKSTDPQYFSDLAKVQKPQYLWIGCSDSRVPPNQIVGLLPGEIFVTRNIANVVARSDLNVLSCLQYSVDCLGVKHVIVCGHYSCGPVQASLEGTRIGLVDNWILNVTDVRNRYKDVLDRCGEKTKADALCELNVIEQLRNVASTHTVADNWKSPTKKDTEKVTLHGWVYNVANGRVLPLVTLRCADDMEDIIRTAVAGVVARHWAGHQNNEHEEVRKTEAEVHT
eukprot:PhF_6_TR6107/c0_g1_i3/m.8992/K01673/cynT, can; carbonic anhydrase